MSSIVDLFYKRAQVVEDDTPEQDTGEFRTGPGASEYEQHRAALINRFFKSAQEEKAILEEWYEFRHDAALRRSSGVPDDDAYKQDNMDFRERLQQASTRAFNDSEVLMDIILEAFPQDIQTIRDWIKYTRIGYRPIGERSYDIK